MGLHEPPRTEVDREQARRRLYEAVRHVRATGRDRCACCGRDGLDPVWGAFRRYYCGLWFCLGCAPEHFGGPRPR